MYYLLTTSTYSHITAFYVFEEFRDSVTLFLDDGEKETNEDRKEGRKEARGAWYISKYRKMVKSPFAIASRPPEFVVKTKPKSHQMFNLIHVQFNMRVHLQILVMSRVDLVLDVLFQVGHLIGRDRD